MRQTRTLANDLFEGLNQEGEQEQKKFKVEKTPNLEELMQNFYQVLNDAVHYPAMGRSARLHAARSDSHGCR